jgi:hypothetical protein
MSRPLKQFYLKRLLSQALRYKFLLGLRWRRHAERRLAFVFPWLIDGDDRVTAPDWERGAHTSRRLRERSNGCGRSRHRRSRR